MKKDDNPQAFKHWINKDLVERMSIAISSVWPEFNASEFRKVSTRLPSLEMKPRVQAIRDQLHVYLPQNYKKSLKILIASLKIENLKGFDLWPYTEFIQAYGLDNFEDSMSALYLITQKFTSEFAVRPFIINHPHETYALLKKWSHDNNVHVRRWVSEGTRPRLPWGLKLSPAISNPHEGLKILDNLKFDPELYVRKSVANHLNDISKDHPDLVVQTLKKWKKACPKKSQEHFSWLQRHALRTLIKKGYKPALSLMGASQKVKIRCSQLKSTKSQYKINDTLEFSFLLSSLASKPQKIIVDYIIHFQKARGATALKVFKLKNLVLEAGDQLKVHKRHSLKVITTRVYYPGLHRLEIQVNGHVYSSLEWDLIL